MTNNPNATVIIPTYNQAHFLRQALDSVLAQTDRDWEVIIVNDGSTDDTAEIADEYVRLDSRISCVHKLNGGVASALNLGLQNARGEWIHWLSSDDLFEPQKLAINRTWIEQNPTTNFFFSYFTLLREETGKRERRDLWGPLPKPQHQILTLFYRNYISGISICIRRSAWERTGYFDETLRYAQDYDQWLRLLQKNKAVFIPEWTVISRNHAAQGSETFPDACYFDTAKAAIRFINQHPFQELVPWADLNDIPSAIDTVTYALEIAADRSAFLYSLGYHPALVLRIYEWVLNDCSISNLKDAVRTKIIQMSYVGGDDNWSWMWRKLAIAVHSDVAHFYYTAINPVHVALCEYQYRRACDNATHKKLSEYLILFNGITPVEPSISLKKMPRVVLLVRSVAEREESLCVAERLAVHGLRLLILLADDNPAPGTNVLLQHQWGTVVSISSLDLKILSLLGEVELAVVWPSSALPAWVAALSHFFVSDEYSVADIEQQVLSKFAVDTETSTRTIAFLERVLWGGGAERVVYDLVRYLDRTRYRPVILTMFDEHTIAPAFPVDVVHYNVSKRQKEGDDSGQHVEPTKSMLGVLRKIYHRLTSAKLREKLALGSQLHKLKRPFNKQRQQYSCRMNAENHQSLSSDTYQEKLALDYVSAMAHHSPCAAGVARIVNTLGKNVLLIAVMEEAVVTAWLAQAGSIVPYIASLHSLESLCLPDIFPSPSRLKAESRLFTASCNEAREIVFPSQGCCGDLTSHFAVPKETVKRIWNPVDCSAIRRLSLQPDDKASQWAQTENCFRLIHVGRLDTQKNHDLLIASCVELNKRFRDFSLVIAGEGHDRGRIEKLIKASGLDGQVTLIGEQKNPFPWIAAADALLLTSRFEAFALVLVEAMVCGTPTVSVDCPAGPAEVLDHGRYGLLTPNDDPYLLADAIERLMDDPCLAQHFISQGLQRAQEFDVKAIVRQWETLIDSIPSEQINS